MPPTTVFDRITVRTLALGLAAFVTLATMAGVNEMAAAPQDDAAPAQIAQSTPGASDAAVQRVVITGHRVRG